MNYYTVKMIRTGHAYQEGSLIVEADSAVEARDKALALNDKAKGEIVTWQTLDFDPEVREIGEIALLDVWAD